MATEHLHVLLVEDDRDLAWVQKTCLEREGISVSLAFDGAEGLEMAVRMRPDVVIADLVLPLLDGLQLISTLARQPMRPPIIAVSAVGSRLHAARELGAVEALVKP